MKSVLIYITTMQCFQQKRKRWKHCIKYGDFIQSTKAYKFRNFAFVTRFSTDQRLKVLAEKMHIFTNQLSKPLSKTREFKLKKLLKEISISPPEIAHTNNTSIKNLDLTANDKEIIWSNQDLHDGIIGAAIN